MARDNSLEVRFTANMRQLERELARLQRVNNQAAQRMQNAHTRAARQSTAAWRTAGAELKKMAGVLAAGFGAREIIRAADTYQRFTNSLKVAGVEAYNLKDVQEQLFSIAQRNGVELESLGQLYARAAQSASALGATSAQLMQFTEGVATALRVAGTDAATASGSLLQLAQALGSGVVRAEEFNSVNEGARPILEAVAIGSDKFKGSVNALRAAVLKGKVTSEEFFQAFLAGSATLEERAARAVLTVDQAMTQLSNAFDKFIGQQGEMTGASVAITNAIQGIADHLPEIATGLILIAGLYGASFIPALAKATVAMGTQTIAAARLAAFQTAMTASMTGASVAGTRLAATMGGLSAVMGGPLGIALTAITAGIAFYTYKTAQAKAEQANLGTEIDSLTEKLGLEKSATIQAAAEKDNVTRANVIAKAAELGLKIEVDKLTDSLWLQAEALRAVAYEKAKVMRQKAYENVQTALREERDKRRSYSTVGSYVPGSGGGGVTPKPLTAKQERDALAAVAKRPEGQALIDANNNVKELRDNPRSTEAFLPNREAPVSDGGGSGGSKRGRGRRDPSDGADEIARAEVEILQARLEEETDLEARAALRRQIFEAEQVAARAAIAKQVTDNRITETAGETLLAKQAELAQVQEAAMERELQNEARDRQLQIDRELVQLSADEKEEEARFLEEIASRSKDAKQKRELETKAFNLRQDAERELFKLSQRDFAARMQGIMTQEEINKFLAARLELFNQGQSQEGTNFERGQDDKDPSIKDRIEGWANSQGTFNEQVFGSLKSNIDGFTDSLTQAIMGTKSLKEAFNQMAKAIIADIIKMAVKFVIFEAIGMALGIKGLGKASIGLGGSKAGGVKVGGNQKGTDYFSGGLTMVGENGPELVALPRATQIMPNNLLRRAAQPIAGTSAPQQAVNVFTTVNANDAVLKDWVQKEVAQANVKAVSAAKDITMRHITKSNRNNLYKG